MLTLEGHAKVMDFGLAKRMLATETEEVPQETPTDLTVAGSTVGTIPYMSPEQILGQEVDQRSDLFSFGIILYEMVGGKHPFLERLFPCHLPFYPQPHSSSYSWRL